MNVLNLLPLDDAQRAVLMAGAPAATFVHASRADVTDDQIARADVIVGNLAPTRLAAATNLKLLQLNSAGYDKYSGPGILPAGAQLASAVGAYGQAVSEHMFTMLLCLMKRLHTYRDDQRAHEWTDRGQVTTLAGARVLVLGCGDIGGHFARLCRAMGAEVHGVRRNLGAAPEGFTAVHAMDELDALLPEQDVVASFLPSSPSTKGLADAAFFEKMRAGAFFVNGGRGGLVIQEDIIAALESGHLAGAALDVTAPEPLPADHPLWDAPGAFVTPHVSGQFHLPVVLDNIAAIAAENIAHLAAGEPVRNAVAL